MNVFGTVRTIVDPALISCTIVSVIESSLVIPGFTDTRVEEAEYIERSVIRYGCVA